MVAHLSARQHKWQQLIADARRENDPLKHRWDSVFFTYGVHIETHAVLFGPSNQYDSS